MLVLEDIRIIIVSLEKKVVLILFNLKRNRLIINRYHYFKIQKDFLDNNLENIQKKISKFVIWSRIVKHGEETLNFNNPVNTSYGNELNLNFKFVVSSRHLFNIYIIAINSNNNIRGLQNRFDCKSEINLFISMDL